MIKLIEVLLTAEIYNRFEELKEDDIPKELRKLFYQNGGIRRPLVVKYDMLKKFGNAEEVKKLPFVDFNNFNKQFKITSLDLAAKWFVKNGIDLIKKNPVLAYYFQNFDSVGVSYEDVKREVEPVYSDREWVRLKIEELSKDESYAEMLTLVRIFSPEEINVDFSDVALEEEQLLEVKKIEIAIKERDYLRRIGLTDIGKLLFVGPPGTGKTTTARALSKKLMLPLVEVRLSMITSQYLGETSKNIEKVFEIAKKLSPCILFIDEFDYVAKTRTSDEHAAVKRAVNTLLKSIDEINLVEHGVLLIAATNHPSLLDAAVWRRFDKIVEFPEPSERVRRRLFEMMLSKLDNSYDIDKLVEETEGFTGAEIKLIVREAVLTALIEGRRVPTMDDLIKAIEEMKGRIKLKKSY